VRTVRPARRRAARGCSRAARRFVAYFLRCVEVLQRAGVTPLCVFDGGKLPSKAAEEAERERCAVWRGAPTRAARAGAHARRLAPQRRKRTENREKAEAHVRSGAPALPPPLTTCTPCWRRAARRGADADGPPAARR
jgi:hypothetical protein